MKKVKIKALRKMTYMKLAFFGVKLIMERKEIDWGIEQVTDELARRMKAWEKNKKSEKLQERT